MNKFKFFNQVRRLVSYLESNSPRDNRVMFVLVIDPLNQCDLIDGIEDHIEHMKFNGLKPTCGFFSEYVSPSFPMKILGISINKVFLNLRFQNDIQPKVILIRK